MKTKFKSALILVVVLIGGIVSNNCSQDTPIVAVQGVSLDVTTHTFKSLTEPLDLTATVKPANAADPAVSWSSTDSAIATVAEGKVTPVAGGVTTIKAKAGAFTATCRVVVPFPDVTFSIPVEEDVKLKVGVPLTVKASGQENDLITYTSSNTTVATVGDKTGVINPKTAGQTIITATAVSGKFDFFTLTVEADAAAEAKYVTGITFTATAAAPQLIGKGDASAPIAGLTVAPAEATNKKMSYRSENNNIATVDSEGYITGVAVGETKIFITALGADPAKPVVVQCPIKVTVPKPVTGIVVKPTTMTVGKDETKRLSVSVLPADATNKALIFECADLTGGKVIVDNYGYVTGMDVTTAAVKITVKSAENPNLTLTGNTCMVTVTAEATTPEGGAGSVSSVVVAEPAITLMKTGGISTYKLTPTVYPTTATNKKLSFTASPEGIVTLTPNADNTYCDITLPTKLVLGTTRITVVTEDGGKTAFCDVTVKDAYVAVTDVQVINRLMTLEKDATQRVNVIVLPENATNKAVTYTLTGGADAAVVDSYGYVTGIRAGTATITVTSVDKPALPLTNNKCMIDVTNPVIAVVLNPTSIEMLTNDTASLTAIVYPIEGSGGTNRKVNFYSSDQTIVTTSPETSEDDGITTLTSKGKPGVARITAVSVVGSKTTYCDVKVIKSDVTEVIVQPETLLMNKREKKSLQSVDVKPPTATNKSLSYLSEEATIASVDENGEITGVGAGGPIKIWAISKDDATKKDYCDVTVQAIAVTDFTLTYSPSTLTVGDQATEAVPTLTPTAPINAIFKSVVYSQNRSTKAVIDAASGKVKLLAAATAPLNITVTAVLTNDDGSTVTKTAIVKIIAAP